jgi:hypothetical protein
MAGPHFDPTLNLGHLLTIIALLGSVAGAYYSLQGAVQLDEQRITTLEKQASSSISFQSAVLDKLTSIQVDIGVLKTKVGVP